MKKVKQTIILLAAVLFMTACGSQGERRAVIMEQLERGEIPAVVEVYAVDPLDSEVAWAGTKIGGEHDGTIGIHHGAFYVFDDELLAGEVVIDMTQIVVLDIQDPSNNARLKSHLESDDFFSVETYPTATFEITSVQPIEDALPGEESHRIFGNMTIKGITHGIAFDGLIEVGEDYINAWADFDLDRSRWDVRFGSGSFFDNLGDNLIHDDFNLKLQIIARK